MLTTCLLYFFAFAVLVLALSSYHDVCIVALFYFFVHLLLLGGFSWSCIFFCRMLGKNTNSCHGEMSTNVSNMLIYYETILPCCYLHIRVGSYGSQRVVGREPSASCLGIQVFFCIFILFDWNYVNFWLVTYLHFPDVLVAICGDNFTSSDLPKIPSPF